MDIVVTTVPPSAPYIAITFKNVYDSRLMSDYDQTFRLSRAEAEALLEQLKLQLWTPQ